MRIRRTRILLVLLACAGSSLFIGQIACGQQVIRAQATPEKQAAAPAPKNNVRPAIRWKQSDYTCEGGAKIAVYQHDSAAKVRTQEHVYMMRQTSSADGNRYSDGKILWWSRGATGFLQEDTPEGDGKMLVKGCILDKPAAAARP